MSEISYLKSTDCRELPKILRGFFCGEEQVHVMGRLLHGNCISIRKALKGPKSPGLHIFPQLIKDSSPDIIGIQVLYSAICVESATQNFFDLHFFLVPYTVIPDICVESNFGQKTLR